MSTTERLPNSSSLTLILGGVRSGKSQFAQSLALELGGDHVLFVATAETRDQEMERRVNLHRQSRPIGWQTLEQPLQVGEALCRVVDLPAVVLLDCLTLLVSNVMFSDPSLFGDADGVESTLLPERAASIEAKLQSELDQLFTAVSRRPFHLVVVSGEVGMGIVPEHALGRLFRDLLGRANQWLAARASATYLMVAGLPVSVSSLATSVQCAAQELRVRQARVSQ